jgi:hypothetical protein
MKTRRKFLTGVGVGAASLVLAESAHGFGRRSRGCGDPVCVEPTECNYRRRGQSFLCILCVKGCAVYIHGKRYNEGKYELSVWHWLDYDETPPMWACELPWDSHCIVKSNLTDHAGQDFIGHDFTVLGPEDMEEKDREAKKMKKTISCSGVSVYCCSRYGQRPPEHPCCKPWYACCITCGDTIICVQSGSCVQCGNVCIPCNH